MRASHLRFRPFVAGHSVLVTILGSRSFPPPHPLIGRMLVAKIRVYPAIKLMACCEPPDVLSDTGGEQRLGHLLGVGGMRGDQAVREIPQRMARGQRLGISHVQGRAADLVRAQRPD